MSKVKEYYDNPMQVRYPWWSKYLDRYMKNYSREHVAADLNYSGKTCLDIGCGEGVLLNQYLYSKYEKLTGVDISSELVNKAKKSAKNNTKFVKDEIENFLKKLVKKGIKYDDVYLLAIIEHIFWPKYFIRDLSKVVKKGGRVVVEVPNVAWFPHRLRLLLGSFPETAPTYEVIPGVHDEHIRFYTVNTLNKLFEGYGFKNILIDCTGRFRRIKNLNVNLLSPDILAVYEKNK